MLLQVDIGGVWVSFGYPGDSGAEPFFPYLVSMEPVQEARSDIAASASCSLSLKAKDLIGLNVQRPVRFVADDGEVPFAGLIARLEYNNDIQLTAEA